MAWTSIGCRERDAVYHDNGRYERLSVGSSLTDLFGDYGEAQIVTEWHDPDDRPVLKDVRWPDPDSHVDRKPCEHYEWTSDGDD